MGENATLLLPKTLKINIESFSSQHHSKIKIAKRRSTVFLHQAIDFCLYSGDIDTDSFRGGLSGGEKDELDK